MKNFVKWFGIIAFIAVIGFSMTACPAGDNDDGGNNGGGNAVIGAKLELSGQVYTRTVNVTSYAYTFSEYKGKSTVADNNDGSVTITGGKLSYNIETPKNLETWTDLQDKLLHSVCL